MGEAIELYNIEKIVLLNLSEFLFSLLFLFKIKVCLDIDIFPCALGFYLLLACNMADH